MSSWWIVKVTFSFDTITVGGIVFLGGACLMLTDQNKYKYKYANLITLGGIVFMGGVRSMLADELEHWETVLLARRRPSHWKVKRLSSLPTKRDCCSTICPHDVPPIAKTELVCTDMLVTLEGTVRTSSLIWLTTCTQDFMTLIIIITTASLLSSSTRCSPGFQHDKCKVLHQ